MFLLPFADDKQHKARELDMPDYTDSRKQSTRKWRVSPANVN